MVMRFPLLSAVLAAGVLNAADWSGTFEVVETVAGPAPAEADRREIEAAAKSLESRLAKAREALKSSSAVVARTYRQDIAHLEAELETLALERGGTVTLGRTSYAVRGQRVAADGDEARVVGDGVAGTAVVVAPGKREKVTLVKTPIKPPADAAAGTPVGGIATVRGTFTIGGDTCVATYAPDLPNVYALTRVPAQGSDSLSAALAGLPGLPLEVERRTARGVQRWTVQKLVAAPIDDRLLSD